MSRILAIAVAAVFTLIAARLPAAEAAGGLPIHLINYSRLPVHATAVAIPQQNLWSRMKLAEGTPVCIRRTEGGQLAQARGMRGGKPVIWLCVSLAPETRLDLVAEPADRWPEASVTEAKCNAADATGQLRNGVIRVDFGKKGWDLAFEHAGASGEANLLVKQASLDFWIDHENRGRLLNSNPVDLGLAHYADAKLVSASAMVKPGGEAVFQIERAMTGRAEGMTVVESFELPAGLPVLLHRVAWRNVTDRPLWVAYVGSGSGVAGRWAKPLMAGPLIERKKSPVLGDLNGSETRPAWLPQLCRISMESTTTGCGVGMSTLLPMPNKVGQGSMVWGCGASGFQCNLIDPVQGQFPFRIEPRGTLENGFAFLATQTDLSTYRQAVELWQALQRRTLPALAPPCAVFLGEDAIEAQAVTEMASRPQLLLDRAEIRQAALRLDFNKSLELRAALDASPLNPVEIAMRPLVHGKGDVVVLRTDRPGAYAIDLNQHVPKADEVALLLQVRSRDAQAVKSLAIAEVLPTAPRVLSPVPDAEVTDFAVMFRWRQMPMVVDYELQLARADDFAQPTLVSITSSQESPWYMPPEAALPAPGRWFWRMRGRKGNVLGSWSETRTFHVNDAHTNRSLRRPLTTESPLFTLEATRVLDYTAFAPDLPADLAPYFAVVVEGFEGKGMTVSDFARGMEKLPCAIMLRSHWVSLADIEWLCQHLPNFVGMQGGEHLSSLYQDNRDGDMVYHHRLTKLCAKYGLFFQEADGTYKDDKWQDLMDRQGEFVRRYGPWLVLSQKNNIIRRQFYSQSAAMGLWLGGITHHHGAWEDGGFYWQNAGFRDLGQCSGERTGVLSTMPRIFWALNCVMGISRGCGIYSLDGQTLMVSPKEIERGSAFKAALWDNTGKTTDAFKRFVLPLVRGTVAHRLVPTKAEVLKNVKLAVYNDKRVTGDPKAWPHYMEYGPLYAGTYGFRTMKNIDGQLWEFFPNTGRYYYLPVLPQGNESLGPAIQNLPVSALRSLEAVRARFDAAYPAWYEGEGLVCRIGDTLTVQNSHENEDITERFRVPLGRGGFASLAGAVEPHSYIVARFEQDGRRFWLQTNSEFADRGMALTILCARRPRWRIEPAEAGTARWDDARQSVELRLGQRAGAVEVTLDEE